MKTPTNFSYTSLKYSKDAKSLLDDSPKIFFLKVRLAYLTVIITLFVICFSISYPTEIKGSLIINAHQSAQIYFESRESIEFSDVPDQGLRMKLNAQKSFLIPKHSLIIYNNSVAFSTKDLDNVLKAELIAHKGKLVIVEFSKQNLLKIIIRKKG